jgi:UDP-glucose 4-epimerase
LFPGSSFEIVVGRASGHADESITTVMPRRVLMTGATGFIGRHVLASLKAQDVVVRTLGRRSPAETGRIRVDHVLADVREDFSFAAEGCDCIIHLAGLADASSSFERPVEFAEINVIGTLRALEAARRSQAAIVIASSQRIYRPAIRPLTEDAPVGPIDPYGESKLQAEGWTHLYNQLYGVRATVLRLFSVYGPGQASGRASGVVSIFMQTAREGQPLRVRARQVRDFIDVRDVVRAIDLAVRNPPHDIRVCNVGTGRATSIHELGELVRQVVGSTVPLIVDLSRGAESYVADPRRAVTDLGFQAQVELLDGLVWYNRQLESPNPGRE